MPRYIDADKFKEHIASFTGLFTEEGFMIDYQAVLTAIDNASVAEVVPKSEVDLYRKQVDELEDELASTYEKLEGTIAGQETLQKALANAKNDVAREIFEEIEDNYADFLFDGYRDIVVLTEKEFNELKKKYTEEQT